MAGQHRGQVFPRAQSWSTGRHGFRISVLLYKTAVHSCAVCGARPAVHFVAVDGRGRHRGFRGEGYFCDRHRPVKGTLPPLDCTRLVAGGPVVVYEHLNPVPGRVCAGCGSPAVFEARLQCQGCADPAWWAEMGHVEFTGDRPAQVADERFHIQHTAAEQWTCTVHQPAGIPAQQNGVSA